MGKENNTPKFYQWVKGENKGIVEELTEEKDGFLFFESKRRILASVLNEYMLQVPEGTESINMSFEQFTDADSINASVNLPTTGIRTHNTHQNPNELEKSLTPPVKQKSPLQVLLEKQNEKGAYKLKVKFTYELSVPKKQTFNVLKESFNFEDEEIINELVTSSSDLVNTGEFKKFLKETIKNNIENYYKPIKKDSNE